MNNVLNDEQSILYSHYLYALQRRRLLIERIEAKLAEEFIKLKMSNNESGSTK